MESEYVPPEFNENAFNCPHCGAYAKQTWSKATHNNVITGFVTSRCAKCGSYSIWAEQKLRYPISSTAPRPHNEMPEEVARDFNEAREIVDSSPRAAAALLRLGIQRLLENHLETPGNGINNDIAHLVEDGKIGNRTKKMLDGVRITGNNSVHPGRMEMDDNSEMAHALFKLTNYIVDQTLGRDKEVEEFWESLPEEDREGVRNRDSN